MHSKVSILIDHIQWLQNGTFVQWISCAQLHLVINTPLEEDKPISFIRDCYGSSCGNHALSQIHQSSQLQLYDHVHVTDKPKYLNSTYVSVETRLTADCQYSGPLSAVRLQFRVIVQTSYTTLMNCILSTSKIIFFFFDLFLEYFQNLT